MSVLCLNIQVSMLKVASFPIIEQLPQEAPEEPCSYCHNAYDSRMMKEVYYLSRFLEKVEFKR